MISIKRQQVERALPRVRIGLDKYLWLQNEVHKRNVINDKEFQKKFNAFYRVRRGQDWQEHFYKLLETHKETGANFRDILVNLHKKTGRMEASFASKLVATIDPRLPIIDTVVFKNLGLRLPPVGAKDRDVLIEKKYRALKKEFLLFLQTKNGEYLTKQFIKEYPKANITKVKMLDLILWQTRD